MAKFSFTFMIGTFLILCTAIFVMVYACKLLSANGLGEGIVFINEAGYISTLGLTIYCYEGIGIVMPVMSASKEPERFKEMLIYAFVTLMLIYIIFAEISYMAWGTNFDEPLVTQMLPADNTAVIIIKFLFSLNLICSFPIAINPTNTALESWLCSCLKNR